MSKVDEMKKIIKPLIKECLTEILMEEGLMKIIKENNQIEFTEKKKDSYQEKEMQFMQKNNKKPVNIQEAKQNLRKHIGMGGFDPFAGSTPVLDSKEIVDESDFEDVNPAQKVLPGIQGAGIDISGLMGQNKNLWKSNLDVLMGKKEE